MKRRLVERHGLPDDVEVWVTRLRVTPGPGPEVEVFLFPTTGPGYRDEVGAQERAHGFENHVGLFLETPDEEVIGGLIDGLETAGQFLFEGSAHNPHENTTMFYFAPNARVAGDRRRFPRWELQCPGDLSALAARRPVRGAELRQAYARLMANRPAEHVPSVVLTTPRHVTPAR
ncbi:hypothetical protein [Streptomyces sp. NPDC101132]|uniref:hypothetical protein n=1 Tax=Streptomyces sp. NPDC101132 TaxID=3366110 RepID=UPI003826C342